MLTHFRLPWCDKEIWSPESTFSTLSCVALYSPRVQLHASTSAHKLNIPSASSYTIVWTHVNTAVCTHWQVWVVLLALAAAAAFPRQGYPKVLLREKWSVKKMNTKQDKNTHMPDHANREHRQVQLTSRGPSLSMMWAATRKALQAFDRWSVRGGDGMSALLVTRSMPAIWWSKRQLRTPFLRVSITLTQNSKDLLSCWQCASFNVCI